MPVSGLRPVPRMSDLGEHMNDDFDESDDQQQGEALTVTCKPQHEVHVRRWRYAA